MNYPLISEYIESIKSVEDNFKELSYLRPVLGDDGLPVMTSGNFAVVFKMEDVETGKLYAVKCFTREQEGREEAYKLIAEELEGVDSPYIVPIRYLEKELFVDSMQTDETEFPVLLMDWVEGKTLNKYLRDNLDDKNALELLVYRFSLLAHWLISQPFAHGDLKPDNILVREDGTLVLIDYDGMYVPGMWCVMARELGSPNFRHPKRTPKRTIFDFDADIDDFPLISILLSLKAISLYPKLLDEYGDVGRLLLSEKDYCDLGTCNLLKEYYPSDNSQLNILISLLTISLYLPTYSHSNVFRCFLAQIINTEVSTEELINGWIDDGTKDYEVKYSTDKHKLLDVQYYHDISYYESKYHICELEYYIINGTKVICNKAFSRIKGLATVLIPNSVILIGEEAFSHCTNLTAIDFPNSVTEIGKRAFAYCVDISSLIIPSNVIYIGRGAFAGCECLETIIVSSNNPTYDSRNNCNAIIETKTNTLIAGCKNTIIPDSVTAIGDYAFEYCEHLSAIEIPNSVTYIGKEAFYWCRGLKTITFPNSVVTIGDDAFSHCSRLASVVFSNDMICIAHDAFTSCNYLRQIIIPKGTRSKFELLLPEYKFELIEK